MEEKGKKKEKRKKTFMLNLINFYLFFFLQCLRVSGCGMAINPFMLQSRRPRGIAERTGTPQVHQRGFSENSGSKYMWKPLRSYCCRQKTASNWERRHQQNEPVLSAKQEDTYSREPLSEAFG